MPSSSDRLSQLRARADAFTGIAFVQVLDVCDQRVLRIYFHTDPDALSEPFEDTGAGGTAVPLSPDDIRIHSPRGEAPDVVLHPDPARLLWADDPVLGRRYLQLEVLEPGTFTDYRLAIDDARIDAGFNDITFSFKVGCDDALDCAEPLEPCVGVPGKEADVDYLARDFVSFRNALLDFTARHYPNWQTPEVADVAMVPLELIAALGDELSYLQDRLNREAYLETATERRSLRHKARLMDYEIHDGRQAGTVLELSVLPGTTGVPAGAGVWALADGQAPVAFELGTGLDEALALPLPRLYAVDERWNPGLITPYALDDDGACLMPGATELLVRNDAADPDNPGGVVFTVADLPAWRGRRLLLRDRAADVTETERLVLVTVEAIELTRDPLFAIDIARIRWRAEDAPRFHLPLDELELSANLVPATAGETRRQSFRLGPLRDGDPPDMLSAVEREGPLHSNADPALLTRRDPCEEGGIEAADRPPIYLLSLPGTEQQGLAFVDPLDDLRATTPEVHVTEDGQPDVWRTVRGLLLCGPDDQVVSLEDGSWRRIAAYPSGAERVIHHDYASGAGYTVRFGDGEFGRLPPRDAVFHVDYRLGSGQRANLPAGAISALSIPNQIPPHSGPLATLLASVRNPFPVTDGFDPESADQIRQLAPDAYRASTFFAVRPEDYGAQAGTLERVQRARGAFRWTGSYLSATVAVDPAGTGTLSEDLREEVQALLDTRRQAGRDVVVSPPRYVNLDLRIAICLARTAFAGQVEPRVREALLGDGSSLQNGFFAADNFTFGTPLHRPALEAAIGSVAGVEGVAGVELRVHGVTDFAPFDEFAFEVADDELIRLENTRRHPERGSLRLTMVGGA